MLTRPGVTTAPSSSTRSSAVRFGPVADGSDEAVLDEDPARPKLGAGVVAGDDPAAAEEAAHALSGTSSKRSTSTSPWSVIFRCGITESPRKESVRNGVAPVQPSACAASLHARLCSTTIASGASESSPAIGSGHSASTRPASTATMPPPISASRAIPRKPCPRPTGRRRRGCGRRGRRTTRARRARDPSPRRSRARCGRSRDAVRRRRSSQGRARGRRRRARRPPAAL